MFRSININSRFKLLDQGARCKGQASNLIRWPISWDRVTLATATTLSSRLQDKTPVGSIASHQLIWKDLGPCPLRTMWVLESDGEAFQGNISLRMLACTANDWLILVGKKLWLRPGKKFLFGRTTSERMESHASSYVRTLLIKIAAGTVTIDDKTISRKHLIVEIASVGPADCVNHQQTT